MNAVSSISLGLALLSLTISTNAQQSAPGSAPTSATAPASSQTPPDAQAASAQSSPSQTSPAATSTPDATAPPPPTGLKLSPTYVIGPDDSIQVLVWKEPSLSGTFPVRPDGMISIPLVGDVSVAGRTPMDLSRELTDKLKKFVNDPTVTVSMIAINSKRIFLAGEVGHIGPMALSAAMNPLQAILQAGGLSQYASKTKIYILREVDGKQKKIPFNYKKAIKNGDMQGITLISGDTIVVP